MLIFVKRFDQQQIKLVIDERVEIIEKTQNSEDNEQKKIDFFVTPLAVPKPGGLGLEPHWTGNWPSNYKEMPLSDHRDTACPKTQVMGEFWQV